MSRTYKAVQVTKPGKLEVVERAIIEPAFGQVRIRVEAVAFATLMPLRWKAVFLDSLTHAFPAMK